MTARLLVIAMILAMVTPLFAACGRVDAPSPPPGVPNIYPKAYPSADQH